jgi:hypothetical protein
MRDRFSRMADWPGAAHDRERGRCVCARACVCLCMRACEGGGSGLYAYGSRAVNDMPALLRSDAPEMNAFGFQFFCQKTHA